MAKAAFGVLSPAEPGCGLDFDKTEKVTKTEERT